MSSFPRRLAQSPAALLLTLLSLASINHPAYAGDGDKVATAKTADPPPVLDPNLKKDAQVAFIAYFSSRVDNPDVAQGRLDRATAGLNLAKEKLNACGGLRNVVDDDLKDLAKHLQGGLPEAERFRPLLADGWLVLVIVDPKEREWCSRPAVISPYMDTFNQIVLARDEHKKLNPQRYLAAARTAASATVASNNNGARPVAEVARQGTSNGDLVKVTASK